MTASVLKFVGTTLIVSFVVGMKATLSFAGGGGITVGNGGEGVVCKTQSQTSIELLDIYEAKRLYPVSGWSDASGLYAQAEIENFRASFVGLPIAEVLQVVFSDALVASRSLQYGTHFSTFDRGFARVEIPEDCKIVQLAMSRKNLPGTMDVLINRPLWEALSPRQQALVIIHEALHQRFPGSSDSVAVRQLTAYIGGDLNFKIRNEEIAKQILSTGQAAADVSFRY